MITQRSWTKGYTAREDWEIEAAGNTWKSKNEWNSPCFVPISKERHSLHSISKTCIIVFIYYTRSQLYRSSFHFKQIIQFLAIKKDISPKKTLNIWLPLNVCSAFTENTPQRFHVRFQSVIIHILKELRFWTISSN